MPRSCSASCWMAALITTRCCGRSPRQVRPLRPVASQQLPQFAQELPSRASQPGHNKGQPKLEVLFARPCPLPRPSRTFGSGLHRCAEADLQVSEVVQGCQPDGGGRHGEYHFQGVFAFSSPPLWRIKTALLLPFGSNLFGFKNSKLFRRFAAELWARGSYLVNALTAVLVCGIAIQLCSMTSCDFES